MSALSFHMKSTDSTIVKLYSLSNTLSHPVLQFLIVHLRVPLYWYLLLS